jgi:hypothetical protein
MATLITEGKHRGEFLATESVGRRSRDTVTVITGQNLGVGRVCGQITASGKWTAVAPGASDGSQVATGILFGAVDATSADKTGVMVTRACEVNRNELDFGALNNTQIAAAIVQLAAVGIIVRAAV